MEEGDKKHEEYLKSFADSMKTLTDVISNGFGMLHKCQDLIALHNMGTNSNIPNQTMGACSSQPIETQTTKSTEENPSLERL